MKKNNRVKFQYLCPNFYKRGFTIVELLIAMTLFVVFIGISTGSFIRILRTQRLITSLMEASSNASLTLEQISREIRTGSEFNVIGENELRFLNTEGVATIYRLKDKSIEKGAGSDFDNIVYKKITADNIKINNFNIFILENDLDNRFQPRITIGLSVAVDYEQIKNITINIQTTVSSRVLGI
ncbi:prepilin-type N-terminal cleavage/methylation domain-containing protein [Candidatus Wolfebacteria bacterium]|nr:prepilin-type N-terminal cleavage/methylation domain-containing protein [Candidatus Wolfebacteria bacterium]